MRYPVVDRSLMESVAKQFSVKNNPRFSFLQLKKNLRKEMEKTIKGKQPAIIAINHPFCKESVLFPTHHFN